MPPAMMAKSSPRDTRARYGRTNSGASTIPTKMFAAAESPTTPPRRISFSRAHDRGQDAPIKEQRAQRAHHEHDRQRAKSEHESCSRIGHLERGRAAAEIAEHEARAGLGRLDRKSTRL